MPDELDRHHPLLAPITGAGTAPSSVAGYPLGCRSEHGLRAGASELESPARDTRPDRATRFIETTRGILPYSEIAPLLAESVLCLETAIYRLQYSSWPTDEQLVAEFHRRICQDLVPDWAGHWRTIDVRVGNLTPPQPSRVPELMRDYGADLMARWSDASASLSELTLELLAFAEGRFLNIHPFQDFNGRTIRLFLLELLRRLDLPCVVLAPESEEDRQTYLQALEAADRADWQPLMQIWQQRFTSTQDEP